MDESDGSPQEERDECQWISNRTWTDLKSLLSHTIFCMSVDICEGVCVGLGEDLWNSRMSISQGLESCLGMSVIPLKNPGIHSEKFPVLKCDS